MSDEEAVGGVSRNRGSLVSFAGGLAVAWIAPYRLMRFAETRRDGSVMTGSSTWNLPDYGIKQRQQPSRKEQVCGVTLAADPGHISNSALRRQQTTPAPPRPSATPIVVHSNPIVDCSHKLSMRFQLPASSFQDFRHQPLVIFGRYQHVLRRAATRDTCRVRADDVGFRFSNFGQRGFLLSALKHSELSGASCHFSSVASCTTCTLVTAWTK
ncbi:hypothetical protein SNOG_06111 [Parastagonospora nodorum SN15]|uniref:Uncharacterized protein n=1 Tax=Phaeosphaeria nodorum (strain SN15 / ATCC MYA-4574 / FGSC 10173) TaxID=321614 RepID=Q0UQ53_PHANO|nr:hypothetical protein SNOG_06111 [Parastagonospora nodorum SN15]EAT85942.1 hypothetical protein SNOG_06111 [Parastagonospora nodorum SN15]